LNLNSQQYTLLKDILIDYNEDYKELQKYKHHVKEKIEDLLKENDFNKKEFIALLKDLKYKHLEIEAYKIERIHNILDKKQRKRLAHYIEEWELD
jgi:NADH:ubiquinone oxidoreductase subunit E